MNPYQTLFDPELQDEPDAEDIEMDLAIPANWKCKVKRPTELNWERRPR